MTLVEGSPEDADSMTPICMQDISRIEHGFMGHFVTFRFLLDRLCISVIIRKAHNLIYDIYKFQVAQCR